MEGGGGIRFEREGRVALVDWEDMVNCTKVKISLMHFVKLYISISDIFGLR